MTPRLADDIRTLRAVCENLVSESEGREARPIVFALPAEMILEILDLIPVQTAGHPSGVFSRSTTGAGGLASARPGIFGSAARAGYCPWCQANHAAEPPCAAQAILPPQLIGRA